VTYTDSAAVTGTVSLMGVWLHDPSDPEDVTPYHFLYGRDMRGDDFDPLPSGEFYAGRVRPLVDFGEHVKESVDVSFIVPHGPDYQTELQEIRDLVEAKQTVLYRDGRGRLAYGVLMKLSRKDADVGTKVVSDLLCVDYYEGDQVVIA
jgi:hypothetical protein